MFLSNDTSGLFVTHLTTAMQCWNKAIQTIGIKLTDDRNRSIDLNGLHFQISLMITLVDKVDIVPELTKYTRRKNELYLQDKLSQEQSKPKKKTKRKSRRKKK